MAESVEVEHGAFELRRLPRRQTAQVQSGQQPLKADSFLDVFYSFLFGHRVPPSRSYAKIRPGRRAVNFFSGVGALVMSMVGMNRYIVTSRNGLWLCN